MIGKIKKIFIKIKLEIWKIILKLIVANLV
jgi:hypothetical protein